MSTETGELDVRAAGGSERSTPSPTVDAGGQEAPRSGGHGPAWDYFTDSVPLRGDRDLREREERISRLEQARPPRRLRRPRPRAGMVVLAIVVLAAAGLSVLGRSTSQKSSEPRSTPQRTPYVPPVIATTPTIGLAPAIRVERAKPRRPSPRVEPRSHPRRKPPERTVPVPEEEPVTPTAPAPEAAEPEVVVEPEEAVEVSPEAATEAPASVAPPESEPKTSPSSEANRQFGFGR